MFQSSDQNIMFDFPPVDDRPINRPTFMLVGLGVTIDVAPTTSEELLLSKIKGGDYPSELEIVKRDLSSPAVMDWLHVIRDGPIPLDHETIVRVVYPNTDENEVNITFEGYWM